MDAYIEHEYRVINSLRAPKTDSEAPQVAPADRFFTFKHYLDGNGELIDKEIMKIVAKAMIRNKPDSYCQAWDVATTGISDFVADLVRIYADYGVDVSARPAYLGRYGQVRRPPGALRRLWNRVRHSREPAFLPNHRRPQA
jgi:hypothetical protein